VVETFEYRDHIFFFKKDIIALFTQPKLIYWMKTI